MATIPTEVKPYQGSAVDTGAVQREAQAASASIRTYQGLADQLSESVGSVDQFMEGQAKLEAQTRLNLLGDELANEQSLLDERYQETSLDTDLEGYAGEADTMFQRVASRYQEGANARVLRHMGPAVQALEAKAAYERDASIRVHATARQQHQAAVGRNHSSNTIFQTANVEVYEGLFQQGDEIIGSLPGFTPDQERAARLNWADRSTSAHVEGLIAQDRLEEAEQFLKTDKAKNRLKDPAAYWSKLKAAKNVRTESSWLVLNQRISDATAMAKDGVPVDGRALTAAVQSMPGDTEANRQRKQLALESIHIAQGMSQMSPIEGVPTEDLRAANAAVTHELRTNSNLGARERAILKGHNERRNAAIRLRENDLPMAAVHESPSARQAWTAYAREEDPARKAAAYRVLRNEVDAFGNTVGIIAHGAVPKNDPYLAQVEQALTMPTMGVEMKADIVDELQTVYGNDVHRVLAEQNIDVPGLKSALAFKQTGNEETLKKIFAGENIATGVGDTTVEKIIREAFPGYNPAYKQDVFRSIHNLTKADYAGNPDKAKDLAGEDSLKPLVVDTVNKYIGLIPGRAVDGGYLASPLVAGGAPDPDFEKKLERLTTRYIPRTPDYGDPYANAAASPQITGDAWLVQTHGSQFYSALNHPISASDLGDDLLLHPTGDNGKYTVYKRMGDGTPRQLFDDQRQPYILDLGKL